MPLTIPTLDDRRYQDLLDEALARIPVHNPEWTNFNKSDPGVTLIEVFAFLTETLLYRSNQIPERNRKKFLSLLGVPLQPASPARGLVTFSNDLDHTITLTDNLEVAAGRVPFRTLQGLDVLPIEARAYFKQTLVAPTDRMQKFYSQLYASHLGDPPQDQPVLYESTPLSTRGGVGVELGRETTDGALWMALLLPASRKPGDKTERGWSELRDQWRRDLFGKTLSLGIVPMVGAEGKTLPPGGRSPSEDLGLLEFSLPTGSLVDSGNGRRLPTYLKVPSSATGDVLSEPGTVQIALPTEGLSLWPGMDPLEAGVGDFPPALDDTNLNDRLITWLRISPRTDRQRLLTAKVQIRLLWVGVNATLVQQRARIIGELLPQGTGEPDQEATLTQPHVLPASVRLTIAPVAGPREVWRVIDDLVAAGPEVPVPDLRATPGASPPTANPAKVFVIDAESGVIRFGDGFRGARPPFSAALRIDYDYSLGAAGNVGPGSLDKGPTLPLGIKVSNPIRTWGGADAESVSTGEKQISRYLQHRDRLVTAEDFATIVMRTPGVDVGRVEVLPAFSPELSNSEPGDAVGAVTLLLIPGYDPDHPDSPEPDRFFLDAVCDYVDERRLITTEVYLRGPNYRPIWISIGIDVLAGVSIATVREAVRTRITSYLSPLPPHSDSHLDARAALLTQPTAPLDNGWPIRKGVHALELMAEASRVPGVRFVNGVQLLDETGVRRDQVAMSGLDLPRLVGLSVAVGDPVDVESLRGTSSQPDQTTFVPIPVIPEEC